MGLQAYVQKSVSAHQRALSVRTGSCRIRAIPLKCGMIEAAGRGAESFHSPACEERARRLPKAMDETPFRRHMSHDV
jgi:hypothetical protein